jgi:hypothetical protein
LDNFGGAVPLGTLPLPRPFTARNAELAFQVSSSSSTLVTGAGADNQQRQLNILDNVSLQKGPHSLKFGIDYRRLSPHYGPPAYNQQVYFNDIPSAETGTMLFEIVYSNLPVTFLFRNLGAFAQDTWRIVPRLTMTYGLRWDADFVASTLRGPGFPAVTGYNLSDLSNLALAPSGTPPYKTRWSNVAPRIGLAYQLSESQRWQTVLRGGFGIFYDLASSEAGSTVGSGSGYYPFGSVGIELGTPFGGTATFPLSSTEAAPAPIMPPTVNNPSFLFAFDPSLALPHTLQWNLAVEQGLGKQQTLSVSYIGAAGRRLLQTAGIFPANPGPFRLVQLVTNAGTSDYDALQLQFQRRLFGGLQALGSYSWSHSLDTASAGSISNSSNALSVLNSNINRGASDFDVRNAFSVAVTYDVPAPNINILANAILRGWSTENIIQAQSAPPVDVFYRNLGQLSSGFQTNARPDIVAGPPLYLYGSQYPGGRAFNSTAGAVAGGCPDGLPSIGPFCSPPIGPNTGNPTRQGNLPRNALRGFGSAQWDFAVHREFRIHESLKLQFRAELFNVLNHPNFGPPDGNLGGPTSPNTLFGQSAHLLGKSLTGDFGTGSGGFNPLYQLGGPRSIQFGMKLSF